MPPISLTVCFLDAIVAFLKLYGPTLTFGRISWLIWTFKDNFKWSSLLVFKPKLITGRSCLNDFRTFQITCSVFMVINIRRTDFSGNVGHFLSG